MRLTLLILTLWSGAFLTAQDFTLLTKPTAAGTEVLVLAEDGVAFARAYRAGFTVVAEDGAGNRRPLSGAPTKARFATLDQARGQQLTSAELVLYRYLVFNDSLAADTDKSRMLGAMLHRKLALDRAGLEASGLWFRDEQNTGKYLMLDAGGAVIGRSSPASVLPTAPACSAPQITPAKNQQFITLRWDNSEQVIGYRLQKSINGSAPADLVDGLVIYRDPGEEAAPEDIGKVTEVDKLPVDGNTYRYHVIPVDHFATTTSGCPTAEIVGADIVPPLSPAPEPVVVNAKTNKVLLQWAVPGEEQPAVQRILFAEERDGPYRPLAEVPTGKTTFTETWPAARNRGFYRIGFSDAAGNTIESPPLLALRPDIIPPAVPQGFTASWQNDSVVTLSWAGDATEEVGYRLRLRREGEQWTEIMRFSPEGNTTTDTLPGPHNGGTIYYQLSAYDWIGNESDFAPEVSLELPDQIPPATPVITGLRSVLDSIGLGWTVGRDTSVATVFVEVDSTGKGTFEAFRSLPGAARTLLVTKLPRGRYAFRVRCADAAGNLSGWSAVRTVRVRAPRPPASSGITKITHRPFADGRILLSWTPERQQPAQYLVYQQEKSGKARLLGATTETQYSATGAAPGVGYYIIRQDLDGTMYAPSEVYRLE